MFSRSSRQSALIETKTQLKKAVEAAKSHPKVQHILTRTRASYQATLENNPFRSSPTSSYLPRLPVELILSILSYTSLHDIVTIRLVSQGFRALIDSHNSALAHTLLYHRSPSHILLLSSLFPAKKPTLVYLHTLSTRHTLCSDLGRQLAVRTVTPLFSRHISKPLRRSRRDPAINELHTRLTPHLYHVLYFLLSLRLRFNASLATFTAENHGAAELSTDEIAALYRETQKALIQPLDSKVLVSTHHAFTFLVNTIRIAISPEPPHSQNDVIVAVMLMSENALGRCLEYLLADVASNPWKLRKKFMEDMEKEKDEAAELFGRAGGTVAGRVNNKRRTSSLTDESERVEWRPKIGGVWFHVVEEELKRRGLERHSKAWVHRWEEGELVVGCTGCID